MQALAAQLDASLLEAVQTANPYAVSSLLAQGADVNCRGEDGSAPVHYAATAGDASMLRVLLEARADPNIATPYRDTALHLAAACGNAEVVELLLAAGADALAEDDEGATPAHAARLRGQFHVVAALESADLAPSLAAQLSGASLGAET